MPDQYALTQPAAPKRRLRRALKRGGIAVLFSVVLVIPGLRRLRRRFWLWTALRCVAVLAGGWLISRFIYATAGAGTLVLGLALVIFGLLFRARPQAKTVDHIARDLQALVVVNGGSFLSAVNDRPVADVKLFVNAERVLALSVLPQPLVEIPFAHVRELSAHPGPDENAHQPGTWNLDITWQSSGLTTTRFSYEGIFAEHLARVAETTLRSLWKKELPVLRT